MNPDRLLRCRGTGRSPGCSTLVTVRDAIHFVDIPGAPPGLYCRECALALGWVGVLELARIEKDLRAAGLFSKWHDPRLDKFVKHRPPRLTPGPTSVRGR